MTYKEQENSVEDNVLVSECKKGNLDSFERLVLKYQKRMFNIAYRMTGGYEDASDIVQDAFISAYKNIKTFKGKSKFTTWLFSIVINHSKNRIKNLSVKHRNEPYSVDAPIQTDSNEYMTTPASKELSSLQQIEKKNIQYHVQKCISSISEKFRAVLVLMDIQGFTYNEISEMLGIAQGTVKSKLSRARESLKNCLKHVIGDL